MRTIRGVLRENRDKTDVKLFVVGEKGRAGLERLYKDGFRAVVTEAGKLRPLTFPEVALIVDQILSIPFDQVSFVYNQFKNSISFKTTVEPVSAMHTTLDDPNAFANVEVDGDRTEVLENFYEFRMAVRLLHFMSEQACSEQSTRMTAMDSSSRNAGAMLQRLQRQYNRLRQAKITTELTEIISGATAAEEQVKQQK